MPARAIGGAADSATRGFATRDLSDEHEVSCAGAGKPPRTLMRSKQQKMKILHLLRHAKSDWSDPTLADHDRPLNRRGKRARTIVASHVAGWRVDLVMCSTARRARQTAKPVVAALGCRVQYEEALYAADAAHLLEVVRTLSDRKDPVMLVGHNPSLEELTAILCGQSPKYPTAALGTIDLPVERWDEVSPGCGTLAAFVIPSQLDGMS
jgi:phosphohistidine phosphatase